MSARPAAARLAALPMYLGNPAAVERLWELLAQRLSAAGLADVPSLPVWPTDYHSHWLQPGLLLSQACGYPLVTALGERVRVVGAFQYDVPGCSGVLQRSQIVVRANDPGLELADFRGRRVAFNATDSQSGYNSLRALVAPLARDGHFFGTGLQTGAHRESVRAVRDDHADIASIDCVSLAEFRRHMPDLVRSIRLLAESAAYPGLPLITSALTDDATLALLRESLAQVLRDPAAAASLHDLSISGFQALDFADYQPCLAMHDAALALHCPTL